MADDDTPADVSPALVARRRTFWRRTLALTGGLLLVWFIVTFVAAFYARELNAFVVFGFPLGFYTAAQGALIVYVLIIWVYARAMRRFEADYDAAPHE